MFRQLTAPHAPSAESENSLGYLFHGQGLAILIPLAWNLVVLFLHTCAQKHRPTQPSMRLSRHSNGAGLLRRRGSVEEKRAGMWEIPSRRSGGHLVWHSAVGLLDYSDPKAGREIREKLDTICRKPTRGTFREWPSVAGEDGLGSVLLPDQNPLCPRKGCVSWYQDPLFWPRTRS